MRGFGRKGDREYFVQTVWIESLTIFGCACDSAKRTLQDGGRTREHALQVSLKSLTRLPVRPAYCSHAA